MITGQHEKHFKGVGWRKRRVEDVGAEREVEDEKAGGRGEMKRECIHNE